MSNFLHLKFKLTFDICINNVLKISLKGGIQCKKRLKGSEGYYHFQKVAKSEMKAN